MFRPFTVIRLSLPLLIVLAFGPGPGAALAAEAEPLTLLVLGDSLAAGYGIDRGQAWPAVLERKLRDRGHAVNVVNAGVSGDTTAGGLRRIDWLLKRPVDILLVELGGNDGLRGLDPKATRANLEGILRKARAKYPDIRIVLAGMQMPDNMGETYQQAFEKIFPEVARERDAALIPFLLKGVGGKPELNLPDGIHPLPEGHEIIADNALKVVETVLGERPAAGGQP